LHGYSSNLEFILSESQNREGNPEQYSFSRHNLNADSSHMRTRIFTFFGLAAAVGCSAPSASIPGAHLPRDSHAIDVGTSRSLDPRPEAPKPMPPLPPGPGGNKPFDLPSNLPGANAPPVPPLKFDKNTTQEQREAAIKKAFPEIVPVGAAEVLPGTPMGLADFQQLASQFSPALRKAEADAQAAHGAMVQAGLHPNPMVGYEVDAWQPYLQVPGVGGAGNGQQGGYISQLIKTAGKLKYAQRVAGFDYINALVAVRKARVDVTADVRQAYFAALTAQKGVEVNKALADLTDELYRSKLKQLAAGQAADYEPLQLYSQSVLARNAVVQSETNLRASWKRLAAAIGQPDLAMVPLTGQADAEPPRFDAEEAKAMILESHTDLLTVRNVIEQSKANLHLQRVTPIPDVQTFQYHQYDNLAQQYQLGVQIGIQVPIFDRNQGNIRQAQGRIAGAAENLRMTENNLISKLATAFGQYESNRIVAQNYREKVIPTMAKAYRSMTQRHQVEPDKVTFDDLVLAQQNYGTAMQAYLAALSAQWQAVVDLANLTQQDELILER